MTTKWIFKTADFSTYAIAANYKYVGSEVADGLLLYNGTVSTTYNTRLSSTKSLSIEEFPKVHVPAAYKWCIVWYNDNDEPCGVDGARVWKDGNDLEDSWVIESTGYYYNTATAPTKYRLCLGKTDNTDFTTTELDNANIYAVAAEDIGDYHFTTTELGFGMLLKNDGVDHNYDVRVHSTTYFHLAEYSKIYVPSGCKWVVCWYDEDNADSWSIPAEPSWSAPWAWTETTGLVDVKTAMTVPFKSSTVSSKTCTNTNPTKYRVIFGNQDNTQLTKEKVVTDFYLKH